MLVPVDSAKTAEIISAAIYGLSRPTPDPADVTQYVCGWHVRPRVSAVLMDFDSLPPIPVANQIIKDGALAAALDGLLKDGQITTQAKTAVISKATAAIGATVPADEMLPTAIRAAGITREQAAADGWFAAEAAV